MHGWVIFLKKDKKNLGVTQTKKIFYKSFKRVALETESCPINFKTIKNQGRVVDLEND